jgi:imidazolonepropionase
VNSVAFANIETLVTNDPHQDNGALGALQGASVVVQDGLIAQVSKSVPSGVDRVIDCTGMTLLPGFVDSHSHLIFAGDRSAEFATRSQRKEYTAGGISTTVAATRVASDAQLTANAHKLLDEALLSGTTTIEIKSGYGLNEKDELRSIEIASQFTDETTLLAAHVIPDEFASNPDDYVKLVIDSIIPKSKAKWIDVFCDQGAFTPEQAEEILRTGMAYGMLPRIHANQLSAGKGVELAVALHAASADHLSKSTAHDIELLASSNTVATLLPGAEFSTHFEANLGRRFLDAGATVAIASDCNPGSSYTTSMPFCIAAAVSLLGFSVEEAVHAATLGGAKALYRTDIGRIAIGMRADLVLLSAPSYLYLAYRPGVNLVHSVYKSGRAVTEWQK